MRPARSLDSRRVFFWERGPACDEARILRQRTRFSGETSESTIFSKLAEGTATALGSVLVLGLVGYLYHVYYKALTLRKIEEAFASGYSSLELAALGRQFATLQALCHEETDDDWIPRQEQHTIDRIVDGTIQGQYHLLTGEKGTGKTSMLLMAMSKVQGEGVAMMEAHGDLEIFRIRLGKALNYEFHEDYMGSLFSFKGPRDTTPLLDIERAFNKMEKIALKRREQTGKPLVLILNGVHLLRDNADGQDLLELIQQRAELWAASNLVTVVLNTDEYWITERLMWQATRLRVHSVHDIPMKTALTAMLDFRAKKFHERVPEDILRDIYARTGGRLRFLTRVARSPDMIEACKSIYEQEKRWLLSQCWILGANMDDDAEEQQEFCAATWVLAKALVDREQTSGVSKGELPQIALHEAREIMTRADFIQRLDHINIFTIDANCMVQADSVVMQNIFREICGREGFEQFLQATLRRLDDLESLRRTREITLKDLTDQSFSGTAAKDSQGETILTFGASQVKAERSMPG